MSKDGDEADELRSIVTGERPSAFLVEHGWLITSSYCRKPNNDNGIDTTTTGGAKELMKLQAMNTAETQFWNIQYPTLVNPPTATTLLSTTTQRKKDISKQIGINNIRQKIQSLYEQFIVKEWIPKIKKHIENRVSELIYENNQLGIPIAKDDSYNEVLSLINSGVKGPFSVKVN